MAYLTTEPSFSSTTLHAIAETIANTRVWAAYEIDSSKDWWDWYDEIHDKSFQDMADEVLKLVPAAKRKILETDTLMIEDDFSDPRFQNVMLEYVASRRTFLLSDRDASTKRIAFAALDAFGKCQFKESVSSDVIAPIVEAARTKSKPLQDMAVLMLLLLGTEFDSARHELRQLLSHRDASVRFSLISQFGYYYRISLPADFIRQIYTVGIQDKSAKVRILAGARLQQSWTKRLAAAT